MPQSLIPNPDADDMFGEPDGQVGDYFPLVTPLPAPDTFEIGLVLGGTVSAAAYTAGVIDFLVQALDAWTVAKERGDPLVPNHKVVVKVAAGTSGGGILCVLLSRILGSAFPHCTPDVPASVRALNPLYDVWVNQIDIRDLLETSDLTGEGMIRSVLCAAKLDEVCKQMSDYAGAPLGSSGTPASRDYVEAWLPVILTLTNLRGIPYSAYFRGSERKEYFLDHADHMRFRVDTRGHNPPPPDGFKPYEIAISDTPATDMEAWDAIIHAARGTSAFPAGFPPQTIVRDARHYLYRYAVIEEESVPKAVWMRPEWAYMIPIGADANTPYQFLCVDGGCFDNEPIEFARQHLAGVLGQNARAGDKARRAVLLVDPFADTPTLGLMDDPGIMGTMSGTLSAFIGGTRFETADLDLFTAEDVFSRFLISPVGKDENGYVQTGGAALATSSLGAFGGFLSAAYREHDFFLGRRNCQQFLRTSFMLKQENALFDGTREMQVADKDGCLPIVPLIGDEVNAPIPRPVWPKNAFSPESIRDLIDKRLTKLAERPVELLTNSPRWRGSWLIDFMVSKLGSLPTDMVIKMITQGLQAGDLLD